MLRSKRGGVGHKFLHDGANGKMTVLPLATPQIHAFFPLHVSILLGWRVFNPSDFASDLDFLSGRKKEVAVCPDGEVFSVLLLQPAIYTTLAVERVEKVDIELAASKRAVKAGKSFKIRRWVEMELW